MRTSTYEIIVTAQALERAFQEDDGFAGEFQEFYETLSAIMEAENHPVFQEAEAMLTIGDTFEMINEELSGEDPPKREKLTEALLRLKGIFLKHDDTTATADLDNKEEINQMQELFLEEIERRQADYEYLNEIIEEMTNELRSIEDSDTTLEDVVEEIDSAEEITNDWKDDPKDYF